MCVDVNSSRLLIFCCWQGIICTTYIRHRRSIENVRGRGSISIIYGMEKNYIQAVLDLFLFSPVFCSTWLTFTRDLKRRIIFANLLLCVRNCVKAFVISRIEFGSDGDMKAFVSLKFDIQSLSQILLKKDFCVFNKQN